MATLLLRNVTAACHAAPFASGQMLLESDLYVADRGVAQNGSDGQIRRYTFDGNFISALPAAGSGQIRGIAVALIGDVYVARGNDLIRYLSPTMTPDSAPVTTGFKAQDVAIHPVTGNLWVSFGSAPADAEIREVTPDGLVVQTLTSPLLDHPRSLEFDEDGSTLFIANVLGFEILAVDVSATPPVFSQHSDLGSFGAASFSPIGIARDPSKETTTLYVTGDWMTTNEVLRVTGAPGAATVTSALNYASIPGFKAPSDLVCDSWGNLVYAARSFNMGVAGFYTFRGDNGLPTAAPNVDAVHLRPIDVAFLRRPLDVAVTSGDVTNDVFISGGVPSVNIGQSVQPDIRIMIDSPDYPMSAYVVLFSLLTNGQCAAGEPVRPIGSGLPVTANERRLLPLEPDSVLNLSLAMLSQSISSGSFVPFPLDPTVCPTSIPGNSLFLYGVTDGSGHAEAFIQIPSFPDACFPFPFTVDFGYAVIILDGFTGPLGIGQMSSSPACLHLLNS